MSMNAMLFWFILHADYFAIEKFCITDLSLTINRKYNIDFYFQILFQFFLECVGWNRNDSIFICLLFCNFIRKFIDIVRWMCAIAFDLDFEQKWRPEISNWHSSKHLFFWLIFIFEKNRINPNKLIYRIQWM